MIAYDRLSQIIPADQALANKALSVSLQQLAGVQNLTLPVLANTISQLETTRDLPLVTALTTAVPSYVSDYYKNHLGAGDGKPVLITNVLGLAAGWVATDAFTETVAIFSTMDLTYLTLIYQTMAHLVAGDYSYADPDYPGDGITYVIIPAGLPAAGTYYPDVIPNPPPNEPPPNYITVVSAEDKAMSVLITDAQAECAHLVSIYPSQTSQLNTLWTGMCQQVVTEKLLQPKVGINFSQLVNNTNTVYSFIESLGTYGTDTQVGGMAWFIENVADLNTFAGQSMVAALRQGRNMPLLNNAGIQTSTTIPLTPNPPLAQANLIPSTYTAQQAANTVVK